MPKGEEGGGLEGDAEGTLIPQPLTLPTPPCDDPPRDTDQDRGDDVTTNQWELIDMRGTLVARYETEKQAEKAADDLNGRLRPGVDACYDYKRAAKTEK